MESRVINVSEHREYQPVLDCFNFHPTPSNSNTGCYPQNSNCLQNGSWTNYSSLSASPVPAAEAWANFYASENRRLRGENEMLKFELQKCYAYVSKQKAELKEVKQFEQVQRRYLESQRIKANAEQKDVNYLEKQLLERQNELQAITANASVLQTKFETLTKLGGEAQEKIAAQEKQIKELENIMAEQQDALDQLSLGKTVLDGKLTGIREFVKEINSEFVHNLEILTRDHSINFKNTGDTDITSCDDEHSNNGDDEDETGLKNLEKNLHCLSTIVRATFEEVRQIRLIGNQGISKVYLRKQVGSENGASETWSVVPNQEPLADKTRRCVPSLLPLNNTTALQSSVDLNCTHGNHGIHCNHNNNNNNSRFHRATFNSLLPNCCSCGYQAKDKHGLQKHLRYFNYPLLFSCRLCKRRFIGMSYLKTHYHQKHKIPQDSNKNCAFCGATFPTLGDVQQHCKLVHQRWSSPYHDASNNSTVSFIHFMDVFHSEELPPSQFKCSCCSQTFENQERLEQHIRNTTENVNKEKKDF